jgi:hypothetical protein
MLVSVLVAGEGAEALAAELGDAGAAAEVLQGGQAPAGFDLAILLTDAQDAASPRTRAVVDVLARSSDRLLLAPVPLGEVAAGSAPALPELPLWFEMFAELGYQPVVEFDASFVSAGAFLVDRAATADEADLAAFTDRLSLGAEAASAQRAAVAEAERSVRTELQEARAAVAERDTQLAGVRQLLGAARDEITSLTDQLEASTRAAEAFVQASAEAAAAKLAEVEQRNSGWDGLRAWARLEVASPERNTLAALARDLPRLNTLRAPDLPPVSLPERKARRSWLARLRGGAPAADGDPVLEDAALVRACKLFDAAWYVAANAEAFAAAPLDPAFHYVLVGGPRGVDPGPWFDTAAYLVSEPEAASGPLQHAIRSGAVERAQLPTE